MHCKTVIKIDTQFKNASDSNSSFVWDLGKTVLNITGFNLSDYYIPNSSYIVNSFNYQFLVTYNAVNYVISITRQNYNATQLATELQTQLNTIAAVFTVTYNTQTNKFSFSSSALAFVFNFTDYPRCARLLGFENTATTSSTSLTAPNCSRILISPYYTIVIAELPTTNYQKKGTSTFTINNNYNAGIVASPVANDLINNFYKLPDPISCSKLSVQLLDSDYNLVDLNGMSWFCEIQLFHS